MTETAIAPAVGEGTGRARVIAASSREAAMDLHRLAATYVLGLLEDAGRIPAAG